MKNTKLLIVLGVAVIGLGWWQKRALQNMIIGVNDDTLNLPNVQAMLKAIRVGEGTSDPLGYYRLFGYKSGAQFTDTSDHPRVVVTRGSLKSSAAGAYQFLEGTWDRTAAKYDLPDFSPHSQDLGAVGRIKDRGALLDVVEGHFEDAINKINLEWASLPGSPYGQPTKDMPTELALIAQYGGHDVPAQPSMNLGDLLALIQQYGGAPATPPVA